MRIEAKIKKGFYPLPAAVIPLIAERLVATSRPRSSIHAPRRRCSPWYRRGIGDPATGVYGCELDIGRGKSLPKNFSRAMCFRMSIFWPRPTAVSASIVYVNRLLMTNWGAGGGSNGSSFPGPLSAAWWVESLSWLCLKRFLRIHGLARC